MYFASDNTGPAHPKVIQAITRANTGYTPSYGDDPIMDQVREKMRALLGAPQAEVHLVATGTAANVLALSSLGRPWDAIYCTPRAHIEEDEGNAPEFYTGGAKLMHVGSGARMTAAELRAAVDGTGLHGVHGAARGPVSITQVTERGDVYTLPQLQDLAAVAREFDLPLHMDGARFANAVASLGCSAKDMSTDLGLDALSFGGTKNGLMGVEAVVLFTPDRADQFERRRKRGAHLFSKHRYLSAQFDAYLTDDLWLELAQAANANARHLFDGLQHEGMEITSGGQANMGFVAIPTDLAHRLIDAGAQFYLYPPVGDNTICRFVCDWSLPRAQIDAFLALVAKG